MSDAELKKEEEKAVLDNMSEQFSPEEQAEFGELGNNDKLGKGYSPSASKKRFRFSRKKGAIAGIITTIAVGGGVLGLLQTPNMVINHLRELLLGQVSSLQSTHSLKYRRKKISKIGDMFSKDGRRGGRIIADMENRGYRFRFDPSDNKKIVGLDLPGGRSGIPSYAIADHMSDYLEVRHPMRTSRWKTKRMEAFYSRYKVARKSVVVRVDSDPDDPDRAVNRRIAEQVVGDDVKTEVKTTQAGGEETPEEQRLREERTAANGNVADSDGSFSEIKQKLRDGVPLEELTLEEQNLLRVGGQIDQEVLDLMNNLGGSAGSLPGRTIGGVKGMFSTTDIADKICTVKNRLNGIAIAGRHYRALSLLRYTSVFVAAADETRAGKPSPKLVNALMKRTTALDKNGNSLGASPGFAYILKGKFSKSKNDANKGSFGVDGKLTGVPGAIQGSTNNIPGMSKAQCGVYQSPAFQIGVAAVEIGLGIFSGGGSAAVGAGIRESVKTVATQAMRSIISRQTAKALAKGVVIDLSFEGLLALTQVYAEKSIALNFTSQEKGGELGDILAGGAGVMNKQRSLQSGMVPATSTQYNDAYNQYTAAKTEDKKKQNIYTRIFDYSNQDSLTFQTASIVATSPLSTQGLAVGMNKLAKAIATVPATVFSSFSKFFVNSALAQAQDADDIVYEEYTTKGVGAGTDRASLATDPAGNLLPIMRADIEAIDPITNIKDLTASGDIDGTTYEPLSDRFKKHVENCVNAVDVISTIEKEDQTKPENDCLASQPITVKFKAHLAYIDMLDGIDGQLFPGEINGS